MENLALNWYQHKWNCGTGTSGLFFNLIFFFFKKGGIKEGGCISRFLRVLPTQFCLSCNFFPPVFYCTLASGPPAPLPPSRCPAAGERRPLGSPFPALHAEPVPSRRSRQPACPARNAAAGHSCSASEHRVQTSGGASNLQTQPSLYLMGTHSA